MRKIFAPLTWCAEDVLTVRTGWTKKKAREFLQRNENAIVDAMVEYGFDRIESLIDQEESEDEKTI